MKKLFSTWAVSAGILMLNASNRPIMNSEKLLSHELSHTMESSQHQTFVKNKGILRRNNSFEDYFLHYYPVKQWKNDDFRYSEFLLKPSFGTHFEDYEILESENADISVYKSRGNYFTIFSHNDERSSTEDYYSLFIDASGYKKKFTDSYKDNSVPYVYGSATDFPVIIEIEYTDRDGMQVSATIKAYTWVEINIEGK
ncbi:hypothetical protein [Chryseobacterium sp. HMWF035]|uniref:hypothetical protein n=1 Tax=Chryseobacterium sp. HMWF035 TaxID=2056868 RepID=UPI000F4F87F2|nr:hypothetical protein [Chryseobacterium sp. HMWF035]